jgi:hypothetical protein
MEETEYNSMSLVRRDCRHSRHSSSSYIKKGQRLDADFFARHSEWWDVALFSPLSLTLCPLEWMTCERPHARTPTIASRTFEWTHAQTHRQRKKKRKKEINKKTKTTTKNPCICLKALTAAGFIRNINKFGGRRVFTQKYYPYHHIFHRR